MMNTLLIFFALPIATIIISIVLQKLLKCPFLVAGFIFAIFLVVTFIVGNINFLVATIVYTIIAFITAFLTMIICRFLKENCCDCDNNEGNSGCGCSCNNRRCSNRPGGNCQRNERRCNCGCNYRDIDFREGCSNPNPYHTELLSINSSCQNGNNGNLLTISSNGCNGTENDLLSINTNNGTTISSNNGCSCNCNCSRNNTIAVRANVIPNNRTNGRCGSFSGCYRREN